MILEEGYEHMLKKISISLILLLALAGCGRNNDHLKNSAGNIQPGSMQDFVSNVGDRVFFALNSSSIDSKSLATVQRQAQWMKTYPHIALTVEGHADERGTRDYNIALGARRAAALKNALISQGVPASRIKTVSYGKERPVVTGTTDNEWSLNRRAVAVPQF